MTVRIFLSEVGIGAGTRIHFFFLPLLEWVLFPLNYTVMLLLAFSLQPKETSLFHLIWNSIDVLGLVNLLCSLSQDSGRFTILPLMGRIDPVSLTALRSFLGKELGHHSCTCLVWERCARCDQRMLKTGKAEKFPVYRSQKDLGLT